jgi:Rrf2 family protein
MHLAKEYGKGPVLISQIAGKEKIPRKFLESILLDLKNAGILRSKKGKGGGYFLAKPPQDIPMGHVLRILDGPLAPVPCVSHTAYHKCEDCQDEVTCGIRLVMKEVRDAIAGVLDKTSFQEAVDRVELESRNKIAGPMYEI